MIQLFFFLFADFPLTQHRSEEKMNPFDAPSDFQDFTLHDNYLEPPDLTRRLPIRDDYLLNKETLPQYSIPRPHQSHEGNSITSNNLFSGRFKCFFF